MKNEKSFEGNRSAARRFEQQALLSPGQYQESLAHRTNEGTGRDDGDSRFQGLLRKLGWALAYAGLVSGLVVWGFNSRFGLLLLLLLR